MSDQLIHMMSELGWVILLTAGVFAMMYVVIKLSGRK